MKEIKSRDYEMLNDLFNREEHFSCVNYKADVGTGFRYIVLRSGDEIQEGNVMYNNILFVLKGEIKLTWGNLSPQVIHPKEMVFVARTSAFSCEVLQDTQIVIFWFDQLLNNCDRLRLESFSPICEKIKYDGSPTPIAHPLETFLENMVYYLRNGVNCAHLHEIKHKEFFLCLKAFYSKEAVAHFLHPMVGKSFVFRDFILRNVDVITSVNELIAKSSMGKTQFHSLFKKEFGMTAKQWLIKQKIREIYYEASRPGVSVKELMIFFGFDTSSHFVQFCRQHFGCTPTELIRNLRTDNQ